MAFGSSAEKLEVAEGSRKSSFKPTEEQREIIDAALFEENVSVKAFAGAGKTATQIQIAEAVREKRPGSYVTYFAYNRSMADEAKGRFPGDTIVSTAHSMAFNAQIRGKQVRDIFGGNRLVMGSRIRDLRNRISDDLASDVDPVRAFFPSEFAATTAILQTLQNFLQSDGRTVLPKHASMEHALYVKEMSGVDSAHQFNRAVSEAAQKVWDRMMTDKTFPITHDVYLKAWEMDGTFSGRGLVLFDEAQDANPVMISVLRKLNAAGSQIVLVGDPHQAIYGWRGAVDAMKAFPDFRQLSLTESWRFGKNLAEKAQLFLNAAGETGILKGRNPNPGVFLDERIPSSDFVPDAILCRTNVGVILDTLEAIKSGQKPYIVGGAGSKEGGAQDAANLLEAMGGLHDGDRQRRRHPDIGLFETWDDIVEFAESGEGKQLKGFVEFTMEQKQHGTFDQCVSALRENTAKTPGEADITICTMHKSKGLEWNRVRVGSDLEKVDVVNAHRYNQGADLAFSLSQENYKLLYVAWTRGKEGFDARGFHSKYEAQSLALKDFPLTDDIKQIIREERAAKAEAKRALRNEFSGDE